jgi:hypothetical protein
MGVIKFVFRVLGWLLPIGYSLPMGEGGSRFYDVVTNTWQPILAQVSLFASILSFYLSGMIKPKPISAS